MRWLNFSLPGIVVLLTSCSSAPPQFVTEQHSPLLDETGGPLLITDVCLRETPLIGDHYFVISPGKDVAQAVTGSVTQYIKDNGVQVGAHQIPFECGAIGASQAGTWKVADRIGSATAAMKEPFAVSGALRSDPEYVHALSLLSSYVFSRILGAAGKQVPNAASSLELQKAAAIVKARTHHDGLLYVGVTGNRISTGRRFAEAVGKVAVGTATALATMGMVKVDGTSYGLAIFPAGKSDGWQMVAGLVDLSSGRLVWSGSVVGSSDPMKARNLTPRQGMDILFRGLFYKRSAVWHPPGAPQ